MPQIVQQGQLNRSALQVDDTYINIKPPGPALLTGVPTNVCGVVGSAHWGLIQAPIYIGSPQEALAALGPITDEPFDIPTAIACAASQGAQAFVAVRVADGTEDYAECEILDTSLAVLATVPAIYTGTLGNSLRIFTDTGSRPNTVKVTVQMIGTSLPKEIFDNLRNTSADNFRADLIAAVTLGQGPLRPPSNLVGTPVAGAGTDPVKITGPDPDEAYVFTGGADGNSTLVQNDLVGDATIPTGIYLFQNTGVFQFIVMGLDDSTLWSPIIQYGATNGQTPLLGFASGLSTTNCIAAKNDGGFDTYAAGFFKDYIIWDDPTNLIRRAVPPEAFALGKIGSLAPEQGVGNKPMYGFVGTTRTRDRQPYTNPEIARLETAGINFITNPIPYGNVFGMRHNQNGSSDGNINGMNYTRMTNFLAQSFAAVGGKFIGLLQSSKPNDQLRADVFATFSAFLTKLEQPTLFGGTGQIDAYSLICDLSNNTKTTIGQGYLNVEVAVRYLAVVRFFIVDLTAGQTVVIVSETSPNGLTV